MAMTVTLLFMQLNPFLLFPIGRFLEHGLSTRKPGGNLEAPVLIRIQFLCVFTCPPGRQDPDCRKKGAENDEGLWPHGLPQKKPRVSEGFLPFGLRGSWFVRVLGEEI
jgi:hypothetical protein